MGMGKQERKDVLWRSEWVLRKEWRDEINGKEVTGGDKCWGREKRRLKESNVDKEGMTGGKSDKETMAKVEKRRRWKGWRMKTGRREGKEDKDGQRAAMRNEEWK